MKLKEFVRNPYNYDVNDASEETGLECKDKSLAQQQFVEESDINYIAERFKLNGTIPLMPDGFVWGAAMENVFDYQTAMNAVVAGDRAFMQLPAKIRARFQNNPQQLMEFLADKDNELEARKLGLLKPLEPAQTTTTGGTPIPPKEPPAAGSTPPKTDT